MSIIPLKSLALYKHKPALVRELSDKIVIETENGVVRVREKDIELLHPGPVERLSELDGELPAGFAEEAWALYVGEDAPFSLRELAELAGGWTPRCAWQAWRLAADGLYFEKSGGGLRARPREAVDAELAKRGAKNAENAERSAFLDRLRAKTLVLPDDRRFLQDVEALALGKSDRSRTLKDAALDETPETAHKLLLDTGVWDGFVNPWASRCGVAQTPPKETVDAPDESEPRVDLTALDAFAIDDEDSTDPDDAVSVEMTAEGAVLIVHIADPAARVTPDSPADREARGRGATFYTPEGIARMLGEGALEHFALGLNDASPALSFRISLDAEGGIIKTDIFRSRVRVTRLSYAAAGGVPALAPLFEIAAQNLRRRLSNGAVQIEFPEISLAVRERRVELAPIEPYPSRALVRECMLLAGEAAAAWALERRLPFPYVTQEIESMPAAPPEGYAGGFQLRRCMRPRLLSPKPGLHAALGLDAYTQVTSPLRRYTDLLAHQQISAVLRGETPLDDEQILTRLAASERSAIAVSRAEKHSRAHWMALYLSEKIGETWRGIVLDVRGTHAVALIPALGIETQTALKRGGEPALNDECVLKLSAVDIPRCELRWVCV